MQIAPASSFAAQFGVKALTYGPPGGGKTPLVSTAPRPILLAVEPGLLSMRGSNVPTVNAANNLALVDEFFRWCASSAEAKNYDTICVDSATEIAEMIVREELNKKTKSGGDAHGLKAYGNMSDRVMAYLNQLYYTMNKHVYLTAKQCIVYENGIPTRKPYFPGKDLNTKVPHLYDEILHLAITNVPGVAGEVAALRTRASIDILARDRSGMLAEYEQPNLTHLFNKAMQR